jgi:hypothetical protein
LLNWVIGEKPSADKRLQHGVDMNTSLLNPDGFPRADIDVAQSMGGTLLGITEGKS